MTVIATKKRIQNVGVRALQCLTLTSQFSKSVIFLQVKGMEEGFRPTILEVVISYTVYKRLNICPL